MFTTERFTGLGPSALQRVYDRALYNKFTTERFTPSFRRCSFTTGLRRSALQRVYDRALFTEFTTSLFTNSLQGLCFTTTLQRLGVTGILRRRCLQRVCAAAFSMVFLAIGCVCVRWHFLSLVCEVAYFCRLCVGMVSRMGWYFWVACTRVWEFFNALRAFSRFWLFVSPLVHTTAQMWQVRRQRKLYRLRFGCSCSLLFFFFCSFLVLCWLWHWAGRAIVLHMVGTIGVIPPLSSRG